MVTDDNRPIPVYEWQSQLRRSCLRGFVLDNGRELNFDVAPVGVEDLFEVPEELSASFTIGFLITDKTTCGSDYVAIVDLVFINELENLYCRVGKDLLPSCHNVIIFGTHAVE